MLLGRFLDRAIDQGAGRIHLEVREGNPAIKLYRSAGFAIAGRRRKYYRGSDGSQYDALTLARRM
jgi:[ribosomal protein S18]-alanine N-acetyltransferase